MSQNDVQTWLESNGLGMYKSTFKELGIDGRGMVDIEEGDIDPLFEMKDFHKRSFLSRVVDLRNMPDFL
jgi:hypothetical protein